MLKVCHYLSPSPPTPAFHSTTMMALPTILILQRQLDATLQLVISLAPTMMTEQILMIRLRLTEANILMGTSVSQENNATPNSK